MIVVGLKKSPLAEHLDITLSVSQFADTEMIVSFYNSSDLAGSNVLLIYQFSFGQQATSINDQIIAMFEAVSLIKAHGAKSITLFVPYLPYSRQPSSLLMFGTCLQALGVSKVIACQLHDLAIIPTFPVTLQHLSLEHFWQKVLLDHVIKNQNKNNFCIASPDHGGKERAQALAGLLDVPVVFMNKKRPAPDTPIVLELVGDVLGKQVIILDDIIDTGRTAVSAAKLLQVHGATNVYGCFTHAVFSDGACERIAQSCFEKIFVADTVLSLDNKKIHEKITTVSLHSYLSKRLIDLL